MMTMVPVLLHLGQRKTATTFIQRNFSAFSGVRYLGIPYIDNDVQSFFTELFNERIAYDKEAMKALFERRLRPELEGDLPIVVSNEGMISPPDMIKNFDRGLIMDRLHEFFPQARVLVTIRDQKTLILSLYSDYLKNTTLGFLRPLSFDDWFYTFMERPRAGYYKAILDLWLPVSHARQVFGDDRVSVLPYEWLRDDRPRFLEELAKAASLPPAALTGAFDVKAAAADNTRLDAAQVLSLKLSGRFTVLDRLRRVLPPSVKAVLRQMLRGGEGIPANLREAQITVLRRLYGEKNRLLEEATGLDLKSLGYLTESGE